MIGCTRPVKEHQKLVSKLCMGRNTMCMASLSESLDSDRFSCQHTCTISCTAAPRVWHFSAFHWICNACSGTILLQFCFRLGDVLEVGLVFWLELVLFLQLIYSCMWRYKCEYVSMSRICDVSRAANHVVRFTRPSGSIFAYCKRSKTRAGEGLGMRLILVAST